jgi:PilZ domain-containing protein
MSQSAANSIVESDQEFFELTGPMPKAWKENRRFPRFYFRSCAEAIIYPLRGKDNPPPAQCFVLTRDLSRGGMGLVHSHQLFPGQRVDVLLNGQPPRQVEVVWCRRWTHQRYVAGCRFINTPGELETTPSDVVESVSRSSQS